MSLTPRQLRELETNEAWLTRFETPAPSRDAVRGTQAAVRAQMLRAGVAAAARSESRRRHPAWGAVAAAAMFLISASLIMEGVRTYQPRVVVLMAEPAEPEWLDAFASAADVVSQLDREMALLSEELAMLEGPTADETENLDALVTDLEQLEWNADHLW
ncbi:MAG: hypothetical protein V3T70_00040 [Phycisphaerae bacterium]